MLIVLKGPKITRAFHSQEILVMAADETKPNGQLVIRGLPPMNIPAKAVHQIIDEMAAGNDPMAVTIIQVSDLVL